MTYDGALAKLQAHLAKRGFGDIEVHMTGGYDPTSTEADGGHPRRRSRPAARELDPILWPRNAGSYPGYVFTGEPLQPAGGPLRPGHGSGAHAPDEYIRDRTRPIRR